MIIYKITNLINNKCYIGQTIQYYKRRWNRHKHNYKIKHNHPLYASMNKYGFNNFIFEIIDKANSIEELNLLEQKYIKIFNSLSPNGYNLTSGGFNKKLSQLTRNKMKNSFKEARKKYPPPRLGRIGKENPKSRPVFCNETNEYFESARQAELKYNIPRSHILEICKGNRKSRNKLTFRFA